MTGPFPRWLAGRNSTAGATSSSCWSKRSLITSSPSKNQATAGARKSMWTSDAEGRRAPGSPERRRPRVARRGEEKTMEGRYTGLLVLFFSAALLLPPLRCLFALGGRYEVREITPHVFVWIPEDIRDQDGDPEFSRAGTAGFIIAPEGVVVVETANNPIHARELLFEIRRRADAPVREVIATDPAFCHTRRNQDF